MLTAAPHAAISKPAGMFGRDREWSELVAFATDQGARPTLAVVTGLRRQGKTYLLHALTEALGGLYFDAAPATERESLRMLGAAVGRRVGAGIQLNFGSWPEALDYLFSLAPHRPGLIVLDEFPLLAKNSHELPVQLCRALAEPGSAGDARRSRTRLVICGAATPAMHKMVELGGPLSGQADVELVIRPLDYRDAARFWNIADPRLAVLVHSVVGGTPAYRRQFIRDDLPIDLDDFDGWVLRTVLNPATPLMREARYLLGDELDLRDHALYHSVVAAVADGRVTWSSIAEFVGHRAAELARPMSVLETCGLLAREPDPFRSGRARYRITEPLIAFYAAIMRGSWSRLEQGQGARVWYESSQRFSSLVVQPHFATLCRRFAGSAPGKLFGDPPAGPIQVSPGSVADPGRRTHIPIEVAVLAPTRPGKPRQVISLGLARWDTVMGVDHLDRLHRARQLLATRGYDTDATVLACYSAAGFDADLRAGADPSNVLLVGLDDLYA
ncbi:MAG TPA: ATP-binding protein [Actinomycetes bacterium]|nr:ATP-binding protein [Actinomycetes bacterium]